MQLAWDKHPNCEATVEVSGFTEIIMPRAEGAAEATVKSEESEEHGEANNGKQEKRSPLPSKPLSRLAFFHLRKKSSMRAVDVTIDDGLLKLSEKGLSTSQWNDLVNGLSEEQCAAVTG